MNNAVSNLPRRDAPTDQRGLSRRGFLATAATCGASLGLLGLHAPIDAKALNAGTAVRRNVFALAATAEGMETIAAYSAGVAAMAALPLSDVRSWRFQAAIHVPRGSDAAEIATLPADLQMYLDPSNLCQHGNLRFLPWHRMYLYFFERIVRKASGMPTFSLPYWNYSDSAAERSLPLAFRSPQDEAANPLYRAARAPGINAGLDLPASATGSANALAEPTAGPSAPQLGFYTAVERRPHNIMHVTLGGDGLMSDPETAALDPIFWLHHSNIDRLWSRWIASGHANLTDAAFLDRVHRFWDEDGNLVEMTTRDVMDTVTTLDYRYDDETAVEAGTIVLAEAGTGVESGLPVTELAAVQGAVTLLRQPVAAEAQPLVEAGGAEVFATRTPAQRDRPVVLTLADIRFDTAPRAVFEVYVNPPATDDYVGDPAYLAGLFAPFMPPGADETYTEVFDITGLITRQIDAGLYKGGAINVVVRPAPPLVDTGVEAGALPEVVVSRISVSR